MGVRAIKRRSGVVGGEGGELEDGELGWLMVVWERICPTLHRHGVEPTLDELGMRVDCAAMNFTVKNRL